MDDVHAKEINLVRTTVKIPGLRPKGSRIPSTGGGPPANGVTTEANNTGTTGKYSSLLHVQGSISQVISHKYIDCT